MRAFLGGGGGREEDTAVGMTETLASSTDNNQQKMALVMAEMIEVVAAGTEATVVEVVFAGRQ